MIPKSHRNWPTLALTLLLVAGAGNAIAQTAETPVGVETAVVKLGDVTSATTFDGTVVAIQQVNLMARVEGFLKSQNFTEGSSVTAGSLLFEIQKDTYQAALDGAKAALAGANASQVGAVANLDQAQQTLVRQTTLVRTSAVSQSAVDQAQAARDIANAQVKQAEAQIEQAQAQVTTAQLNLSYTDVTTPISGRIGKALATIGNLVSPSTGPLATVVQTDPIRVVFSISDRQYLAVVNGLKPTNAGFEDAAARFQPKLRLSDGTDYPLPGRISFIDNKIDQTTGTIAVFAEFPNPDLKLVPGQYLSVIVQQGETQKLPVVAASAVQQDREGNYIFTLGESNRATIRRVTLGNRVGTDWAVTSGVANGDIVIVSGIQKIKAGILVDPHPAAGN